MRGYHLSKFGIWLKISLFERQMQQKDLAKLLGISELSVSRYVHGDRTPNMKTMQKILNLFDSHIEIVKNQCGEKNETGRSVKLV